MTDAQIVGCVEAGLGHHPTEQEVAEWRYGQSNRKLTIDEQLAFLEFAFREPASKWRLKVLSQIQQVQPGQLISYGNLASRTNKTSGLGINPRNVAWLRKKIYLTIGHDTDIPIHRVANEGDTKSTRDHPVTQFINRHKRNEEGSLYNPIWLPK